MEHDRQIFFVILGHFFENQNFEKMKKMLQDIITLQMCTINDSHIMYGS